MTIGVDLHTKDVYVNGAHQILQIWDLSGQEQFQFLLKDFATKAHAILLCFDRSRYKSFLNLDYWYDLVCSDKSGIPIILVATKADMDYHPALRPEMAFEFAKKYNLIDFVETSAKEFLNVNSPFIKLIEHLNGLAPDEVTIHFDNERTESGEIAMEIGHEVDMSKNEPVNDIQATKSYQGSMDINFNNRCPKCNAPLRDTQIELKKKGHKILCQSCLEYI